MMFFSHKDNHILRLFFDLGNLGFIYQIKKRVWKKTNPFFIFKNSCINPNKLSGFYFWIDVSAYGFLFLEFAVRVHGLNQKFLRFPVKSLPVGLRGRN